MLFVAVLLVWEMLKAGQDSERSKSTINTEAGIKLISLKGCRGVLSAGKAPWFLGCDHGDAGISF